MATKRSINDYKNRLDSPIGAIRISTKTGKPIKGTRKSTSKKKK